LGELGITEEGKEDERNLRIGIYFLLTVVFGICIIPIGYTTVSGTVSNRDSTNPSNAMYYSSEPATDLGGQQHIAFRQPTTTP
jgi:hypothetical protein